VTPLGSVKIQQFQFCEANYHGGHFDAGSQFARSPLLADERDALFDALLSVSEWVKIHFLWRPNLPDEADTYLIELAVASAARPIITANLADFKPAELLFPHLRVCDAGTYLNERKPT
jgi:hypothetical protein